MTKWLRLIRLPLECLSYVAVVGGIGLFFVQQQATRRAQQIEAALQFVQLENQPLYTEARAALEAPFRKMDASQLTPTEAGRAQLQLSITQQVGDEPIEKLADLYVSILNCRAAEICEPTVVDQFFQLSISGFYCNYDVRLKQISQRLNRPAYADTLHAYSDCD